MIKVAGQNTKPPKLYFAISPEGTKEVWNL